MRRKDGLSSLLLAGPAILIYGGFLVLPAILGFGYSFTNWNGWNKSPVFVGLDNFRELMGDDLFLSSLRFTAIETVLIFAVFTFGAMLVAVLLDRVKRLKGVVRGLFFYPYALSLLVGGLLFQWLANYNDGTINTVLRGAGLASWTREWMGPGWALWLLLAFVTWSAIGFFTTLYLANLQTIPDDLYEASALEGAGPVSVFRHVQFPLLLPTLTTCSVMALIFGTNLFGQIIVLWDKPRTDTYTVAYYVYRVGIEGNRQGYATAISLTMFVVLAAIAIVQVRLLRARQVQL